MIVSATKKFTGYDEKTEPIVFCKVSCEKCYSEKIELNSCVKPSEKEMKSKKFCLNIKSPFLSATLYRFKKKVGETKTE